MRRVVGIVRGLSAGDLAELGMAWFAGLAALDVITSSGMERVNLIFALLLWIIALLHRKEEADAGDGEAPDPDS